MWKGSSEGERRPSIPPVQTGDSAPQEFRRWNIWKLYELISSNWTKSTLIITRKSTDPFGGSDESQGPAGQSPITSQLRRAHRHHPTSVNPSVPISGKLARASDTSVEMCSLLKTHTDMNWVGLTSGCCTRYRGGTAPSKEWRWGWGWVVGKKQVWCPNSGGSCEPCWVVKA